MALNYATSKNFALRMLTGKNPGHEIGTGFASLGEDVDKLLLGIVVQKGSTEGVNGSAYVMVTEPGTLTLPAPTINARIAAYCTEAAKEVTVNASTHGGTIYGDFIHAAATIKLLPWQHVILQADGTANWLIVAGEPQREHQYTAVSKVAAAVKTYESGEYSASRETLVSVKVVGVGTENFPVIEVGGVNVSGTLSMSVAGTEANLAVVVPPGEKLKVNNGDGANTVNVWVSTLSR